MPDALHHWPNVYISSEMGDDDQALYTEACVTAPGSPAAVPDENGFYAVELYISWRQDLPQLHLPRITNPRPDTTMGAAESRLLLPFSAM